MTGWSTTAAASRGARASRWRPSSRSARSSASATRTSPCSTSGSSWARCTASKSRTRGREAGPVGGRARGQESGGRGPVPPAAGAPPAVRDDGTPRCLAPRLAAAAADAGLGGGYGRCRRADPVRALCARGEHGLDVGRTQTPPAHVWALCGALHRSRQSLLLHAQGGDGPHHRAWRGRQPGAEGAGDPPAAGLVPASARAQRARLRDQSRAACRRSCAWRGVGATKTPTPTSSRSSCPTSTGASRCPRRSPAGPSCRWWESIWSCCSPNSTPARCKTTAR